MKASAMSMVGFPLLLIPLAIYNIIAFLMPSVSFGDTLVKLKLVSGAEWPITLSDVMLALGILLLLHEVIKGARPGGKYLTDHLLSLLVFGASAAEFVLWTKFGTSTYFLLVLLAMVDFFSGIALRAQQRGAKVQAAPRAASRQVVEEQRVEESEPETPPHQPHVEPVPVPVSSPVSLPAEPEVPPATSVAESVLLDHPEPKTAPTVVASEPPPPVIAMPAPAPASEPTPVPASEPAAVSESEPSPRISSPDLQPGSGSEAPGSPETPKH
jgi:hypothetical protein